MKKSTSGFTIVELLIVIVVIAILAAISVVAYSGVQDRAEASKTATAVEAYKKALLLYKADKGAYPTQTFCLGDQYGTFTGGSSAACRYSTSEMPVSSGVAGRNALKEYLGGQLPMPSTVFLHGSTTEYVGAHFYSSTYNYTLDGNPVVAIEYYVKGATCPIGPVYAVTAPTFTTPATPLARSSALTDGSRCFVLLPNS